MGLFSRRNPPQVRPRLREEESKIVVTHHRYVRISKDGRHGPTSSRAIVLESRSQVSQVSNELLQILADWNSE